MPRWSRSSTRIADAPRLRHPEKAHRPDQEVLRKPDWIRVKAPTSQGLCRDPRDREVAQPRHGLRGGRLPQYRRVLGQEARHLHDHGRDLHARLRLLQRRDRHARRRSIRTSRPASPRPSRRWACTMSSSPRSTATISPMAAPSISPQVIRAIRAATPATTIEILTPDFLRKDGALEIVVAARPDVFNHNLETVPSQLSDGAPGRALLPLDPAAAAGEGTRSDDLHQVRHHGRARRGAERGAAADGRSALGRCRLPDHRPVSAADEEASSGDEAS